ncbi:hypothetical protein OHB12_11695 [Nocardia sp. NBC_01730]|uniref:hypothetical protein n=1 Tax=Nocardia sp. NBC_01730 TaxID=2975998 RepID=UPI002E0D11DE|nr:hypothetical protein OHB12_11695 [Nocardia sp. NBC_01730]
MPSAFHDALFHLHCLHLNNPRAARTLFPDVLALATPDERAFLDELADTFTRYPFETAHKRLDAMWKTADSERRELINACAPDTDPGLHHRELPGIFEVSLAAAELPPMPVRDRYRPLVTKRAPSRATDAARNTPDQIAARAKARPTSIPGDHRSHVLAYALATDALVTGYVTSALFTDSTAIPDPHAQPEPPLRGDATPVDPEERLPRSRLTRDHAEATELWARAYLNYVADQYDDEHRAAWDAQRNPDAEHADDGAQTLAERARDYLATHDDTVPRARHARRRRPAGASRRRSRITEAEAEAFAAARTVLRVHDDARPEIPNQGNGLDYDDAAMVPVMGWRCVSCFIERAMTDKRPIHARDGQLVSDDGLCDYCRADGRPGIAPLPEKFTVEDFVVSRCEFLAATYPATAHALIAEVWHRAAPHPICRHITRFLATHLGLTPNPAKPLQRAAEVAADAAPRPRAAARRRRAKLGADQRHGRCDGCTTYTVVHADNYCLTCRIDLGLTPARPSQSQAA